MIPTEQTTLIPQHLAARMMGVAIGTLRNMRRSRTGPRWFRRSDGKGRLYYAEASIRQWVAKRDAARNAPRGSCRMTGCSRDIIAHRMCMTHYMRWRRAGRPMGPELRAWLAQQPPVAPYVRAQVQADAPQVVGVVEPVAGPDGI